jgi:hypothetical protein
MECVLQGRKNNKPVYWIACRKWTKNIDEATHYSIEQGKRLGELFSGFIIRLHDQT